MATDLSIATTGQGFLQNQLRGRWRQGKYVCVGLDPSFELLPAALRGYPIAEAIFGFNRSIIEATHEWACAYKPNAAFYERHGPEGVEALIKTVQFIKTHLPDVTVILDAKRGDIGNTNEGYATAAFDVIGAHAMTVHPYLGKEALRPFLDRADRGVFVLVKTSNPGAGEFQDLPFGPAGRPLYEHIARTVAQSWNDGRNCGVVVGAPYTEALRDVRAIIGDMPILVPGIGAQGGELRATVLAGRDSEGGGLVINAARGIIYASSEGDYASAAGFAAERLNRAIVKYAQE